MSARTVGEKTAAEENTAGPTVVSGTAREPRRGRRQLTQARNQGLRERDDAPARPAEHRWPLRMTYAKLSTRYVEGTVRGGPITAWITERHGYPKLHFDVGCDGLETVRAQKPATCSLRRVRFANWSAAASVDWARPCRLCGLERVVAGVHTETGAAGQPGQEDDRQAVFMTFASQPSYGADRNRFLTGDVSDSGRARLERIAGHLGLHHTGTCAGPVAWGYVPLPVAAVIAANLRSVLRPQLAPRTPVEAGFVSLLWSFHTAEAPELHDVPADTDPWDLAELVWT